MEAKRKNVYELAKERIFDVIDGFDNIYVSFSGGKDSGVLLELCLQCIREKKIDRKIGVFHMDYEAQYQMTTDYVDETYRRHADEIIPIRVCVPFRVTTCASMFQTYWRPWDEGMRDKWVRPMPEDCYTWKDFPFYTSEMWDYEFQEKISEWYHEKMHASKTCCLVGLRTQESLDRWRAIHSGKRKNMWEGKGWTKQIGENIYNAYPIYDWKTEDVWVANSKFKWPFNQLYELYYKAGVPIEKQRVASPFLSPAQDTLRLYKAIDPNTWGKMVGRVNGVNFAGLYGGTKAMGWKNIKLPDGYTWKEYMEFLLSTLPEDTRDSYLDKLKTSQEFWRNRGGCLSKQTIGRLKERGVEFEVLEETNYDTDKLPVRMEYVDDIDIPEFKEIPSYKRMCVCIMKNDHLCKYMGFSLTKKEREMREDVMKRYKDAVKVDK